MTRRAWVPYPHIFSLFGLRKTYERVRVMPAPKGNKFAVGNKGGGRHSQLDPKFIRRAELACRAGFTDRELAELFDVSLSAIQKWKRQREEFRNALKVGKAEADNRVERSLYERANGYSYDAVKIFMPAGAKKPVYAPYVEHMPPDVTACIFWMKNRMPERWRDMQNVDHVLGKYIISDRPMTIEQWAAERATVVNEVIDDTASESVTPALPSSIEQRKKGP
jgi:hypothetical protein